MHNEDNQKLQQVYALLQQNDFNAAEKVCADILKNTHNNSECLNTLSFIYSKQNKFLDAIKLLKQAIQLEPNNAAFHNNISNIFKKIHDFHNATLHLYEAIRIASNYAEAFNNLGGIFFLQNLFAKAITMFEEAIQLNPKYLAAHVNLANALIKEDKFSKAISHYNIALQINPNDLAIKQNLSLAYIEIEEFAKAIPLLEEVVASTNNLPKEIYIHLSECYLSNGNVEAAIKNYQKAIDLNPNTEFLHHNLGVLFLREEQYANATIQFKTALHLNPNNKTAKHMVLALEENSDEPQAQAPKQYVIDLFDQYANYYNKHMRDNLTYNVPAIMRNSISEFVTKGMKNINVLDLGCGTGLCSIYFRDLASKLVGIDLSRNMLLHARQLSAYDLLIQGDILATIPGENISFFDFILAADVFVYLGELETILLKCKSSLKNGGKLIFTVEELITPEASAREIEAPLDIINKIDDINDKDKYNTNTQYMLKKTGRYTHSERYIKNLALSLNLKILKTEKIILRKNNNIAINGLLFTLQLQTQ